MFRKMQTAANGLGNGVSMPKGLPYPLGWIATLAVGGITAAVYVDRRAGTLVSGLQQQLNTMASGLQQQLNTMASGLQQQLNAQQLVTQQQQTGLQHQLTIQQQQLTGLQTSLQELNRNVGILIGRYVDTQNPLFLRLSVTSENNIWQSCGA